jgi:septal ring factor EnvC (AmiA/AmiB activator)
LQKFSNLRMTRAVTPGRIRFVTGKELSAVLAECAARTEIARAGVEEARKGIEAATKKQEEAIASQEVIRAEVEKLRPVWERERAEFREERLESKRKADQILAELRDGRDERRALIEAIFRVIDRLDRQQPPPPPDLRSV